MIAVKKRIATMAELRDLKARGYDFSATHLPVTTAQLVFELDSLRAEVAALRAETTKLRSRVDSLDRPLATLVARLRARFFEEAAS